MALRLGCFEKRARDSVLKSDSVHCTVNEVVGCREGSSVGGAVHSQSNQLVLLLTVTSFTRTGARRDLQCSGEYSTVDAVLTDGEFVSCLTVNRQLAD